jgi:outer membrane protein TolC
MRRRLTITALSLALVPAAAGAQAPPREPARPAATRPQPARPATPTGTPTQPPAPVAAAPAQPAAPLPPVNAPLASDAIAQQAYGPGKAPGAQVTLNQAVQLTLAHQPSIALASQDVATARANLQQAQGIFDATFTFEPGADYTQQPVSPGFLRQQKNNRTLMQELHVGFTRANIQLRDILDSTRGLRALPSCPLNFTFQFGNFGSNAFLTDRRDPAELNVGGVNRDLFPFVIADLEESLGGFDLRQFCTGPIGDNTLDQILFEASYGRIVEIQQGQSQGLGGVLASGIEAPFETMRLLAEIAETVAARARLALERLGPLPKDQFTRHVSIRTSLQKPLRNGMSASLELFLESEENNFRDKILDPTYGAAGFPPRFPSSLTAGLVMPLGRGRGSVGTAAQERSARFTLGARQEQVRHVATEQVYRTLLAYIRLVAAQENLKVLERSAERQTSLVTLIDQRVRGGEAAGVETSRAQARAASVAASIASARADIVDARMSLAEAMGLDAASMAEAPAAADRLADVRVDQQTVSALIASATENRRDRLALEQARRASAELARGARADARRTYDVNISAGIAQAYESENFRFLQDERNPIFSEFNPPEEFDETHRFYSPKGYWRGLSGRWEPFVTASISFDIPIGNNAAKGRLAQAQATLRSSEVQYADRVRLIGDNITGVVSSLRAAAEGVLRAREAAARSQGTVDSVLTQLRGGEATLIDTLSTEEELVSDETALLRAQQVYLSTLARLRFEAGQLVSFNGLGDPSETIRFIPTDFVVR